MKTSTPLPNLEGNKAHAKRVRRWAESMDHKGMTIDAALLIFDRAPHVSIRPRGCSLVLNFMPYVRAEGRRKKGETFAEMLCRVAAKALENDAKGITAPSLWDVCEACGDRYSSPTPEGKLCRKCKKGIAEIKRETKPKKDTSIKGVVA